MLLIIYLFEDITNEESPRKFFWKHKFSIPALDDFLLHEIIATAEKQENGRPKKGQAVDRDEYWKGLEAIKYDDAEQANNVTFKEFIYTHVRKYLPAHYEGLVDDWDSIEHWGNMTYLKDKIGEEYVEGIHY